MVTQIFIFLLGISITCGQSNDAIVKSTWPTPTEPFDHRVELDERGRFYVFWNINEDQEEAVFEVHAKTHGWLGLGFSGNGAMEGADIVVGWIRNGENYFTDRHGIGNERPVLDETQNYKLLTAMESDEFTVFKFSRELDTCDSSDFVINAGTTHILFAWNDKKPESEEDFEYHGASQRGNKAVLLVDLGHKHEEILKETQLLSFKMNVINVTLPTERTYYHCRLMALPQLDTKHHIVKIRPIITPGNEGVVHHIVAYFCEGNDNLREEQYGRQCWEGRMPENATDCNRVAYGWAVGGGDFLYPKEAGLSLGDAHDPKFFHIEMHYDNPDEIEGIVDHSGLEFFYTSELRAHDTGTLLLGHSIWWPPLIIPPKSEEFRIDSYCGMSCTNKLPQEGINVVAAFPHTHLTGMKIWTKHIRNGTELPELYRDDHYDFNYQQIRYVPGQRKILPGDELITSCSYKTTHKDKPVYGGPETDDEMCFNFLVYYPLIPLTSCISQTQGFYPWYQLIMERALTGDIDIDPSITDEEDTMDYLEKLKWTSEDLEHMQAQIDNTHGYRQYCVSADSSDGVFGGGSNSFERVVQISKPYVPKTKCPGTIQDAGSAPKGPGVHLFAFVFTVILRMFI